MLPPASTAALLVARLPVGDLEGPTYPAITASGSAAVSAARRSNCWPERSTKVGFSTRSRGG